MSAVQGKMNELRYRSKTTRLRMEERILESRMLEKNFPRCGLHGET